MSQQVTPRDPQTPGIFGYVAGVGASCLVAGSLIGLVGGISNVAQDGHVPGPAEWIAIALVYAPLIALFCATYGLPVAVVGVAVLHLLCRRVRSQTVHVLVAAVCGSALTAAYLRVVHLASGDGPDQRGVVVAVGVAAAAGRLIVVPLVESRRRLARTGRLTGTARW